MELTSLSTIEFVLSLFILFLLGVIIYISKRNKIEYIVDENALLGLEDDWKDVKVRRVRSGYLNSVKIVNLDKVEQD